MAAPSSTSRPSWQRNPVFRFFASLKLAVVLLAVLIIGAIAGTLYESTFDAKVARAYVYGAPWFNIWLLLLASNLIVSALSRWPWKKHHVAFLITHLGIITLLTGSLIGRTWGIEGTITLFKGEPPSNRLLVDQHQLRVRDTDGIVKGYPAEFIHRPPTPQKPWDLGLLAGGARLSIIDYAPAIEGKLNPKPLNEGGAPALHFTIATAMMNQRLESWLLADDHQHGAFNMGLATIELKRGAAPANAPAATPEESKVTAEVEIEETMFAFAKAPEEQIAKVRKGGNSGAKVQLTQPQGGNKGSVIVTLAGKTWTFDVAENLGKDTPMDGSAFTLRIENYWPDFRLDNGKPGSLSDQPNNPAVVVTLRGKGVPVSAAPNAHGNTPGVAPEMPAAGTTPPNHLTLFIADDGSVSYDLASRKARAFHRQARVEQAAHHRLGRLAIDARSHDAARAGVDGFQSRHRRSRDSGVAGRRPHPPPARLGNFRAMDPRRLAGQRARVTRGCAGRLRLETDSIADRVGAAGIRSATQRRQRQSGRIQEHRARHESGGPERHRPMLDE